GGTAVPFPLKKASAARVAQLINTFWASRYPGDSSATNQIRITYEDSTNTVFVQAAPADMAEIQQMIWRIDTTVSDAKNDVRNVRLQRAVADEMAALLLRAISDGIVAAPTPSGLTPLGGAAGAQPGGVGGLGGGGLLGGGFLGVQAAQQQQPARPTTTLPG